MVNNIWGVVFKMVYKDREWWIRDAEWCIRMGYGVQGIRNGEKQNGKWCKGDAICVSEIGRHIGDYEMSIFCKKRLIYKD